MAYEYYIPYGLMAIMCVVFIVAIVKVGGQRKRQIEILERIATALEARNR